MICNLCDLVIPKGSENGEAELCNLESRQNQSPTSELITPTSESPSGEEWLHCGVLPFPNICMFFFKHATCMSLSGTGSSDDCSLTFLAYSSTYGLGYIQA